MNYAYGSHIGKIRDKNEDSAIVIENTHGDIFMMVFDGMGGQNLGDVASYQEQLFLTKEFNRKKKFNGKFDMKCWFKNVLKKTNTFLNRLALDYPNCKGMGTTFAGYLIHKNKVLVGYLGDTRAYLLKDEGISQRSIDETYVQFLYENGKITKEQMKTHKSKHIVTNALGCYPKATINVSFVNDDFDYLLLCSDGLYNMVDEFECARIIRQDKELDTIVNELIELANANGGNDNIAISVYKKERGEGND